MISVKAVQAGTGRLFHTCEAVTRNYGTLHYIRSMHGRWRLNGFHNM